ncbi:MAG TPA: aldo/keto reductase, partial [Rhodospirillales bacterium]|nr:aldo/keto reductase [Rhodospirillales bacterium]
MKINVLGRTDIKVSRICLGTMTYGEQNTEAEGHAQMDMAVDHGVNFFDSAEAYSFPGKPETQGNSERVIGTWMKARGNRADVVIATKIAGPSGDRTHIRNGNLVFNREQVADAVEQSLERLQTDYIDLYQTHWPERKANYFGTLDYTH